MKTLSLPVITATKTPLGYVLWKGKSQLNSKPIVVIATGFGHKSGNVKTGNMLQIHILANNQGPIETYSKKLDTAICGDCKHGSNFYKSCYVKTFQGENMVWRSYLAGSYKPINENEISEVFKGYLVRFGAYGDPSAVPINIWNAILKTAKGATAYTHQWKQKRFQDYKTFCMASVDTPEEYNRARALGWRTFRVRLESEPLLKSEFICPASKEAGMKRNCNSCMACNGNPTDSDTKATVAIVIHGADWKSDRFIKIRKLQKQHKAYKYLLA